MRPLSPSGDWRRSVTFSSDVVIEKLPIQATLTKLWDTHAPHTHTGGGELHTYRDVKLIHIHMKGTHTYIQTDESYTHTYIQREGRGRRKLERNLGRRNLALMGGREKIVSQGGNSDDSLQPYGTVKEFSKIPK